MGENKKTIDDVNEYWNANPFHSVNLRLLRNTS
jgi:hypothetical protein